MNRKKRRKGARKKNCHDQLLDSEMRGLFSQCLLDGEMAASVTSYITGGQIAVIIVIQIHTPSLLDDRNTVTQESRS